MADETEQQTEGPARRVRAGGQPPQVDLTPRGPPEATGGTQAPGTAAVLCSGSPGRQARGPVPASPRGPSRCSPDVLTPLPTPPRRVLEEQPPTRPEGRLRLSLEIPAAVFPKQAAFLEISQEEEDEGLCFKAVCRG